MKRSLARLCFERANHLFSRQMQPGGMLWLARALEKIGDTDAALRVLTEFETRLSIFLALPGHLDIGWSTLTHHFVVEKHPAKNTQTALYS